MQLSERKVDDFLRDLPEADREEMMVLDRAITRVFGKEERALYTGKLWGGSDQEIIGYRPFRYRRRDQEQVEWFLVGLAKQKRYLSVYVNAVDEGKYLSEILGPDLGEVKVGKSSISFKSTADIDFDKLAGLLEKARELGPPSRP